MTDSTSIDRPGGPSTDGPAAEADDPGSQDSQVDQDGRISAPEVAGPQPTDDFGTPEPAHQGDPLYRPDEVPDAAEVDRIFEVMDETDAAAAGTLRRAWGADAGANIAYGRAAVQALASAELVGLLDDYGLGDHPAVLDFAAKIGRRLADGGPATAAASKQEPSRMTNARMTNDSEPGTLDDKLIDLTRQIHDAQDKNDRVMRDRLVKQREQIAERLYGTGPVVGGEGRTI